MQVYALLEGAVLVRLVEAGAYGLAASLLRDVVLAWLEPDVFAGRDLLPCVEPEGLLVEMRLAQSEVETDRGRGKCYYNKHSVHADLDESPGRLVLPDNEDIADDS